MIRCRNCGKPISEKSKVCVSCGTRIRPSQPQNADSYARYRKRKMQVEIQKKRRKRRLRLLILWAILFAIAGAVAGGFYVNRAYKASIVQPTEEAVENTEEAVDVESSEVTEVEEEEQPAATEEPLTAKNLDDKAENYGCSVYEDASYEFKCAYPSEFVDGNLKNNNTRLTLKDENGGAEILICYEKTGKSETASDLMDKYIEKIGVDPDLRNAKENSYTLTFTRIGRVYHRKAVVFNEKHIYYDFIYDEGADNRRSYEEYIDFMDLYLQEMNKPDKKQSN